jgi:hypothetical protein
VSVDVRGLPLNAFIGLPRLVRVVIDRGNLHLISALVIIDAREPVGLDGSNS